MYWKYISILYIMYVTTINEKIGHRFEREQEEVNGKIGRGNDLMIL